MQPFYDANGITIYHADNRDVLPHIGPVASVVTDPPYGLSFMGKEWDKGVPGIAFWQAMLPVLSPGGHLLSFGGSRTFHRIAVAIEDAGFEIRDTLSWLYGSGFPKSHNISKAIDKMANAPATPDVEQWEGWGTALKPAWEPIILARKPFKGTVAQNVLKHGTGALNIDASRIPSETITINTFDDGANPFGGGAGKPYTSRKSQGRWPANVVLDEQAAELLDAQSGVSKSGVAVRRNGNAGKGKFPVKIKPGSDDVGYGDTGGASRFLYVAKASKRERGEGNNHPTVKPLALMRYLIRLVTPPGGIVLDPFMGSGSTLVAAAGLGLPAIGIEMSEEYAEIAARRVEHAIANRDPQLALEGVA